MGCETAYRLIHEYRLEGFYQKLESDLTPVKNQNLEKFLAFDDKTFLEEFSQLDESGVRSAWFSIEGLQCVACVWLIEQLSRLDANCLEARVDYLRRKLFLRWRDGPSNLSQLLRKLSQLGYTAVAIKQDDKQVKVKKAEWLRLGISWGLAIPVMHLGLYFLGAWNNQMPTSFSKSLGWISAALCLPVLLYGAFPFFKSSLQALRFRLFHADLLISVALLTAYGFSLIQTLQGGIEVYYDSVAMLVALLLSGRMLSQKATDRYIKLPGISACLLEKDEKRWVSATSLKKGQRVFINTSDCVPADSKLISKEAFLDESVITGESEPVHKLQLQALKEGAINLGPPIIAEVQTDRPQGFLTRLLENAKGTERPQSSGAEQSFVLLILLIAVLGYALSEQNAVTRAVAVLIVACPCALALSKPLVLNALQRSAFQEGVIIKNLWQCLKLSSLQEVIFDKTGTLTQGYPQVRQAHQLEKLPKEFQEILYYLTSQSEHPYSKAIARHLHERQIGHSTDLGLKAVEVPGQGMKLSFGGHQFEVRASDNSQSSTSFFIDGQERVSFEFEDEIRAEAKGTLEKLKAKGLNLKLLSGDRKASVSNFIERIRFGFSEARSEVTPDQKAQITSSQSIFVGDGLNDSEAMQRAGFGIGFTGSAESNLQFADAYISQKQLSRIVDLVDSSKSAQSLVRINITISVLYNLVGIGLALNDYIGPIICAILMPMSSLSVILISNSRRFFKRQTQ